MPELPERPKLAVFDALETIFALEPLREDLHDVGLPPESLELWMAMTLRDGFAQAAAGATMEFEQVASSALETLLFQHGVDPVEDPQDAVVLRLRELEPHPDVEPAMGALREAGLRVEVLTNGGEAATRHALERAGLDAHVEAVTSAYNVGRWKPHRRPYEAVVEAAGVAPREAVMVTVHGWDAMGARSAGLLAGWAGRHEGRYPPALDAANVEGDDLEDVAGALLSLPVPEARRA